MLDRTFGETAGYDDFVLIRDIEFTSQCEHHMMPFYGRAHIAYTPVERVVGLSKLARLTDIFARRLQTQEHLTAQIAAAIDEVLKPRGVAVMIEAEHTCMSVRGVAKHGSRRSPAASPTVPRQSGRAGALPVDGARTRNGNLAEEFARTARVDIRRYRRPSKKAGVQPKFDASGFDLRRTDAASGDVLMVAHMNDEALARPSQAARPGISAARASAVAKAKAPDTPSAWSRCAWTATRTRSGSDRAIGAACHTGRRRVSTARSRRPMAISHCRSLMRIGCSTRKAVYRK